MTTFTHKAVQQLGAAVDFIKVKCVAATALTTTAATRDVVMQEVCARGTSPMIVSDGYTVGSDSYLIIAMKKGTWTAATLQANIRAAGNSDLDDAVVTLTEQLVG